MRNLIRLKFMRYLFRWETYAVVLINILLGAISGGFAIDLYNFVNTSAFQDYFFPALYISSVFLTMSAVMITESNNLRNGSIRNQLIAGYSKKQVFLSSFVTVLIYGLINGLFYMIPVSLLGGNYLFDEDKKYSVQLVISLTLIYCVITCITTALCLLIDKKSIVTLICTVSVFLLLIMGGYTAKRIDNTEYNYIYSTTQQNTVVKHKNSFYIKSPDRGILEVLTMLNPIQPVNEYILWYLPYTNKYNLNEDRFTYDAVYRAKWDDTKREYQRHTDRLSVYPYYQLGMIILVGGCGLLIFRKRNLK